MSAQENCCASCGSRNGLKHCSRCKTVHYCSKECQKADWKTTHKKVCHFAVLAVSDPSGSTKPTDALTSLLATPSRIITIGRPVKQTTEVMTKAFNIDELRLAVFSLLSARDLLRAQQVCRSWFCTITNERILQQRLFFAAGPGELVFPAMNGAKPFMGIQPRNKRQVEHVEMTKKPAVSGAGSLHLMTTASGVRQEVRAADLHKDDGTDTPIVINPFFTFLWPQLPTNMTSCPYLKLPAKLRTPSSSWRRMQLTSPPILQVDMNLWYTDVGGKGGQLLPSTGKVPSGVTLGHLADLLAAQVSKKRELHWMQIMGHVWWARSADAVVVPKEGDVGNNEAYAGVYVNPSNGIAFPGAF